MEELSLTLDISDINEHKTAARQLIQFAGTERLFLFDAPMGSGKTTFIKSLFFYLGVTHTITSPTYSIVNEYEGKGGLNIYHFDLYRLSSMEELIGIGFEVYLQSGHYLFIEWPELCVPLLKGYMRIIIQQEGNKRYLHAKKIT